MTASQSQSVLVSPPQSAGWCRTFSDCPGSICDGGGFLEMFMWPVIIPGDLTIKNLVIFVILDIVMSSLPWQLYSTTIRQQFSKVLFRNLSVFSEKSVVILLKFDLVVAQWHWKTTHWWDQIKSNMWWLYLKTFDFEKMKNRLETAHWAVAQVQYNTLWIIFLYFSVIWETTQILLSAMFMMTFITDFLQRLLYFPNFYISQSIC